MVSLMVVGSVALDTIRTPFGEAKEILGGSASHASYAASFFAGAGIVGIVGKDFPEMYRSLLKEKVDLSGLQAAAGRTMRWHAYYEYDMNHAHTVKTELNVLKKFKPHVPASYRKCRHVFLANNDPDIQLKIIRIVKKSTIILDTMNRWIENKKDRLMEAIEKTDILLLNESEARQLFQTTNIITAGNRALRLGPKACIIKKGEHGVLLLTEKRIFSLPGYPLENVKDPTGAGDAFGGGFCGYLAKTRDTSEDVLRKAVVYGSALASFNVEDFSLNRLTNLSFSEIEKRYREFQDITRFW